MPSGRGRSARIEARIAPEAFAVVKRAALMQCRSPGDFVAAAQEAAKKAIEEASLISLSIEDQRRFVDFLRNPPTLSPAMNGVGKADSRRVRESSRLMAAELAIDILGVERALGKLFPRS